MTVTSSSSPFSYSSPVADTQAARMEEILRAALAPCEIRIKDQSAAHAGHAGARPEGETHYHVTIISESFEGKIRLDRHRWVHTLLTPHIRTHIHALSLSLMTREEAMRSRSVS